MGSPMQRPFAVDDRADLTALGTSPAMRDVMAQVIQAADDRRHVLLQGEPGTDCESVAWEIYRRGRSSTPFVKVSYTSNSPEALELDLFGYHTSSRTGQGLERRMLERIAKGGLLHQALGGTIFLEHLAQMPARVQAKLARLFRDGEVVVISERAPAVFDVRAIVAVTDDYDQAVREGRVREDLHHFLSQLRIEIPPLRAHREDIPELATRILRDACREADLPPKTLSEPAEHLLSALPWRANARELRDLIHGLVLRVDTDVVELSDVLRLVPLGGSSPTISPGGGTLREARERFEREYIVAVLRQHHGRVPDAARALGIQRTNLYRKMRRLKLNQGGGRS